jgi:hypothetical protein
MNDDAKPWIFAAMVSLLVALAIAACGGGGSAAAGSPSRWTPMESPRGDLECWQTYIGSGVSHVECWPRVPPVTP